MDLKKEKSWTLTYILGGICLVLCVYIGSTLGNKLKLDFTEKNIYSLSEGSKTIVANLSTPITLKLYYSKTAANKGTEGIRGFNNYFYYVKDLLYEYARHSKNNIKLEVIDPRPDTSDEEDALAYGLKHFPISQTENYFFGLVAKSETGAEKIIEFFDPNEQETLEYDVTKLIYSVTHPKKIKLGILSSLEIINEEMSPYLMQMMRMQGKNPKDSWLINQVLKDFYEIKKIDKESEKITGVDILLVIHPKDFSDKINFAIDQFLLEGGKILLMVDPHSLADQNTSAGADPMMGMGGGSLPNSNLKVLMNKWGIDMQDGHYAGDKYLTGFSQMSPNDPPVRLLPLLACDKRCTEATKDPIASDLQNLMFVFPGALTLVDGEKDKISKSDKEREITPIVTTTDKGNSYFASPYEFNDPDGMMRKFTEGNKPVVLAYKIHGKFKSAYPDGVMVDDTAAAPPKNENEGAPANVPKKKLTGLAESKKESAVIVFGDVDFIYDQFAFKQSIFGLAQANNNSALLLNALESLAGSKDLMSIRSKGKFIRPFDVIDNIEVEAEESTHTKVAEINQSLEKYSQELNELGRAANAENISILQNEGIKKKKELAKKIAGLKRELREVKRAGREKVELIGRVLQFLNTLVIPGILLILGLWLHFWKFNFKKAKSV